MTRPDLQDVLAQVNIIREGYGKRPLKRLPKGDFCEARSCPLTNALRVCGVKYVSVLSAWGEIGKPLFLLPPTLYSFREAFDDGEYPELERA